MKVLFFAAAREKAGCSECDVAAAPGETPRSLCGRIVPHMALEGLRPALDYEYCNWDTPVGNAGELAIISPVSGG